LEKIFPCPVGAGTLLVKPFEELPPETISYAGPLGILDCLREEKLSGSTGMNPIKAYWNRAMRFMERYF
ncbi:MAG: hypothetical protein PHT95_08075, partial [Candidatus Omnitrophica bacterium]|nr:hypothetical protein [Candidatus Omnitrophota bacterium]